MSIRRVPIYKTVLKIALLATVVVLNWQCRTLRAWQALRQVDFYIDRASGVNLAGVELDHVRSYEDLTLEQTLRISQALAGAPCRCASGCTSSPKIRPTTR